MDDGLSRPGACCIVAHSFLAEQMTLESPPIVERGSPLLFITFLAEILGYMYVVECSLFCSRRRDRDEAGSFKNVKIATYVLK